MREKCEDRDAAEGFKAEQVIKKTLTIPKWLNDLAERENVNFSRVLQNALKQYLGIKGR